MALAQPTSFGRRASPLHHEGICCHLRFPIEDVCRVNVVFLCSGLLDLNCFEDNRNSFEPLIIKSSTIPSWARVSQKHNEIIGSMQGGKIHFMIPFAVQEIFVGQLKNCSKRIKFVFSLKNPVSHWGLSLVSLPGSSLVVLIKGISIRVMENGVYLAVDETLNKKLQVLILGDKRKIRSNLLILSLINCSSGGRKRGERIKETWLVESLNHMAGISPVIIKVSALPSVTSNFSTVVSTHQSR